MVLCAAGEAFAEMMNATPGNLFSVVCNGYILPYTF
jgi:hypothetical protein